MERKRIPAAERKAVVLKAAGHVFGRDGYAGANLDHIAAAAGVTKPILYRHFDSKKALYLALLTKHQEDLPDFFANVEAPMGGSPESLVGVILDGWFDYVRENSYSWLMLFRDASGDEEIRTRRGEVSVRAREVMAQFIALGGAVPPDQVEATAEMLTTGLAGLALWWIDNPDVPKDALVDIAVRMTAPALSAAA
jgi:AcrR family transcriptional regulator